MLTERELRGLHDDLRRALDGPVLERLGVDRAWVAAFAAHVQARLRGCFSR